MWEIWPTLYRIQGRAVHQDKLLTPNKSVVGDRPKQQLEGFHLPQLITKGQIENVKMYLTSKFISEGGGVRWVGDERGMRACALTLQIPENPLKNRIINTQDSL